MTHQPPFSPAVTVLATIRCTSGDMSGCLFLILCGPRQLFWGFMFVFYCFSYCFQLALSLLCRGILGSKHKQTICFPKQKYSEVIIVYVDPSALKFQKVILNPAFSFLEFSRGINFPFTKVLCSVKCKVFKLFLRWRKGVFIWISNNSGGLVILFRALYQIFLFLTPCLSTS